MLGRQPCELRSPLGYAILALLGRRLGRQPCESLFLLKIICLFGHDNSREQQFGDAHYPRWTPFWHGLQVCLPCLALGPSLSPCPHLARRKLGQKLEVLHETVQEALFVDLPAAINLAPYSESNASA